MGERWLTFILVGSLLGEGAVGEISKHELYWQPDHTHSEVPDADAGSYRRTISADSGVTMTAATTGTLELLKLSGYTLPIAK
jgi:hypothetical protein